MVDDDAELGRSGERAVSRHERRAPRLRCRDVQRIVRSHVGAKCPGSFEELRVPQALDGSAGRRSLRSRRSASSLPRTSRRSTVTIRSSRGSARP